MFPFARSMRKSGPADTTVKRFFCVYPEWRLEQWKRVEELFHESLERPEAERDAYLREACAGDEALHAEVQGLLRSADPGDGFLEGSPLNAVATSKGGRLSPGDMVGRFEILALVGSGGMGDVYRARDTRLDRIVAVKVCRERFTERFEREARAIAAITHPHICTLYDVGPNYLVMEYLEGKPFAGPLEPAQACEYALQAAEALEAAHGKGIIHRDLKPGNILVTEAGVKLVDFGLAKASAPDSGEDLTKESIIPGTLRYMAPEQLDGKPADRRSDIYSLGVVLYEAIAGAPAFAASTPISLAAAILREAPPPLSSIRSGIPEVIDRLIGKCLEKNPNDRWQSASALREALREQPQGKTGKNERKKSRWPWLAAAALVVSVSAYYFAGQSVNTLNTLPVVVLMDTSAPTGVYDAETRAKSGTNADDLNDALQDLPIAMHKETVGVGWNREEQLLKQDPQLILIHRSSFVHALRAEFTPDPAAQKMSANPLPDPTTDAQFENRLTRLGRDKMESILGYVGRTNKKTRFLVYSRDWSPESQKRWMAALMRRFPHLEGRVTPFEAGSHKEGASFRQPVIESRVREAVRASLGLR